MQDFFTRSSYSKITKFKNLCLYTGCSFNLAAHRGGYLPDNGLVRHSVSWRQIINCEMHRQGITTAFSCRNNTNTSTRRLCQIASPADNKTMFLGRGDYAVARHCLPRCSISNSGPSYQKGMSEERTTTILEVEDVSSPKQMDSFRSTSTELNSECIYTFIAVNWTLRQCWFF